MDSIFRGDLVTRAGRLNAWTDSLLVDHGALRLLWTNQAAVVPGQFYRSNHPTPGRLAAMVRRFGIRSVVNLRGLCVNGSDALSREQARRLNLAFFDAPVSSGHPPSRDRALALARILLQAPQPVLVHCKSGADRAGLAAGMFLLLRGGTTRAALDQLSLRFGHLRHSRAGVLTAFFRAFAREAEGKKSFLAWLNEDYDPARLDPERRTGRLADLLHAAILRRE
jgi:protein tyrosine/serine phosphatase